jgi:hypothetical protein
LFSCSYELPFPQAIHFHNDPHCRGAGRIPGEKVDGKLEIRLTSVAV